MVAVAQRHALDVALPPIIERTVIVEGVFAFAPAVERFIDHKQAQPVAGVQEGRGRRVVRASHGVEAGQVNQTEAGGWLAGPLPHMRGPFSGAALAR